MLAPSSHPQGLSAVLKSVIDEWLIPRLVDGFVRGMDLAEMQRSDHTTELIENQPAPRRPGELDACQQRLS